MQLLNYFRDSYRMEFITVTIFLYHGCTFVKPKRILFNVAEKKVTLICLLAAHSRFLSACSVWISFDLIL